jgi:hypothetical protein
VLRDPRFYIAWACAAKNLYALHNGFALRGCSQACLSDDVFGRALHIPILSTCKKLARKNCSALLKVVSRFLLNSRTQD